MPKDTSSADARKFGRRRGTVAAFAVGFAGAVGCSLALPARAQTYIPGQYESGADINLAPQISLDTRFERRQLPVGAQFGLFSIAPSAQIDESFNDNIFASQVGTRADSITNLTVRNSIAYADGINALDVQGYFTQHLYAVHSTENAWEGTIQANFASAVHDDLQLVANGDVKRLVDPRTDPTGLQGLTPTTYEVYDGTAGAVLGHYETGSLELRVGTDRTTYDPLQGSLGPIITNDRNNTELFGEAKFRYTFDQGRALYATVRPNTRDYDRRFDQAGFQRGSSGVRVDAGVDWDIDEVVLLTAETGVQHQSYDDFRFGTVDEPDGRLKLSWWPTLLTNVTVQAAHEYYEAFYTPSPGAVRNKVEGRIDHELRRRWLASASVSFERDDLKDVSTHNTAEIAQLGLKYLFADGFSAGVNYLFAHQTSTGTVVQTGATNFQQNIVTFTIKKLF